MLKKNNLFLRFLLISFSFNILTSADNDAPFGDVLLHHVTNDKSHVYIPLEIGGIDLSITTTEPLSTTANSDIHEIPV